MIRLVGRVEHAERPELLVCQVGVPAEVLELDMHVSLRAGLRVKTIESGAHASELTTQPPASCSLINRVTNPTICRTIPFCICLSR